jgi:UDP-N-acetylmuramoyl-L-alanyl-D-glutamate--2,6-diaminopimelate ligase
MEIERMIAALAPIEVVRQAPAEVRELAYDARAVTPGTLFFCVPGTTADGHDFAAEAVARGAVGLVVERPLEALQQTVAKSVPQLVVADARAAMAVAADVFFGHPSHELTVAAVTGTNGKTTTTFLLMAILDAAGLEPGLLGNIERRVGAERRPSGLNTPEAIDLQRLLREMLDAGNRSCAMEASSHASAQHRLDRVRLAALVFTNLTQDHLDFHGTMERYFEAKRRLFDGVPAAVNVGDPWGRRLAEELGDALTFGLAPDAEVGPEALGRIRFGLRGRFNVENALGAIAAARLLGIGEDAIRAGLESVEGVPGRFEAVDEGQPFTVLVDYAHTPDSLANILRAARELVAGRLVCVFGCGGDRDRGKRPEMGRIASELADLVIVTSDNPRSEDPQAVVDEIVAGAGTDVGVELDRREAIRRAMAGASTGDVVVIAGKGHEQGQEIGGRKLPFDDREVAREALRQLAPTQ